jgi:hypothetical protein
MSPHCSAQPSRTGVTWLGAADGHDGAHIDAGEDTAVLQATLANGGKEVRLVRQFPDGTFLVEAKSGNGLKYLKSEQVFKWLGEKKNTGFSIKELVLQVPTGRCGSGGFSVDVTMHHSLLHKKIESYDVTLLYVLHLFCVMRVRIVQQVMNHVHCHARLPSLSYTPLLCDSVTMCRASC